MSIAGHSAAVCQNNESTQEPTEVIFTEGEMEITNQPIRFVRFRYDSEKRSTHGVLRGSNGLSKSQDNYPTIRLKTHHNKYANQTFLVQVSLYDTTMRAISPHILLKKQDRADSSKYFKPITEQMTQIRDSEYEYKLRDCYITRTKRELKLSTIERKYVELKKWEQQTDRLTQSELDQIRRYCETECRANNQDESKKNFEQVYLGFTIYMQHDNGENTNFETFVGPVLSTPIVNSATFAIKKLCNQFGSMSADTDVTVLISDAKPNNVEVYIFELERDDRGYVKIWEAKIEAKDVEVYKACALLFKAPPYKGPHQQAAEVVCFMHLRRLNDNVFSAQERFTYRRQNNN